MKNIGRKQSWSVLIRSSALYGNENYLNFPRKRKKSLKRWFERRFHYSRKYGASIFNPFLLSRPCPNFVIEFFNTISIPDKCLPFRGFIDE